MLECILANGTEKQRKLAKETLETDNEIRGRRLNRQEARSTVRWADRMREFGFKASPWRAIEAFVPDRCVYDAENTRRLPGEKVRAEGDPPSEDVAVDEAYDGLGATFELFAEEYGRNSIDNRGMRLEATVHYDRNYDNAFWDGRRMVFGDGDIFNRFTAAVDVIGHELTHGVTERTAGLIYWAQSGALNEHVSDVFGSIVKQRQHGHAADDADWLIGAELLEGTDIDGVALRSMKDPGTAYDDALIGKDPQPGHMDDYVHTFSDNGGVHINSGIPNRAFFLAATSIGGFAWDEAGLVWYETLTGPFMRRIMQFRAFAWLTVYTAAQLFGPGDHVPEAIYEAWQEVGVLPPTLT